MGKDWLMFFTRLATTLVLAGIGATQAPARTCDLGGAVAGDRGERVVVTAWHDDSERTSMEMIAEVFANGDGVFLLRALPWFETQQCGHHRVVVVARSKSRIGLLEARGDGGSCQCAPVREDGTFRIRAPAGQNRIYLRASMGYNEPSEYVTVTEGRDTEVVWKVTLHGKRR